MSSIFEFELRTPNGPQKLSVESGSTLLIVGANGGGKTRLATFIEDQLGLAAHRIAGHRALSLNPEVAKSSERQALAGLRTGVARESTGAQDRRSNRYRGKSPAIALLNDFDFLVQALFAEQANTALETHKKARAGSGGAPKPTKFEKLQDIWKRLLPHRTLEITGDNIVVSVSGQPSMYSAGELSDGERAVFYLIGQTLVAAPDSLLIFDEPELHIHRSILGPLWDELEASRPDCAFLVISHDLEFVSSRRGQKYVTRSYLPDTGWSIEEVPEDTGFSEGLTALILGTRRPVLFIEGEGCSLDLAVYRSCYPEWTIIPRGSCSQVIHSVATLKASPDLTRVRCAGLVDADDYSEAEMQTLNAKGIAVLPVSEVENLFVLPTVLDAILGHEGHDTAELVRIREEILDLVFAHAGEPKNKLSSILRFCRRRIDRTLKKIDLSASNDVPALAASYVAETAGLDVTALAKTAEAQIDAAIANRDAALLLRWFDNKGLMALAARAKASTVGKFEQWIARSLRNGSSPKLQKALSDVLPAIP